MSKFKIGQLVVVSFKMLGDVVGVVTEVHKSLLLPMSEPEYAPGVTVRVMQATDVWQVGDLVCSHDSGVKLAGVGTSDCYSHFGPSAGVPVSGDCAGPTVEGTDVLDSALELALCGVDFDSELAWACDVRPGRPYPLDVSQDWMPVGPSDLVSRLNSVSSGTRLVDVWLTRELCGDCEGHAA
jgi:hypothetical protein